MNEDGVRNLLHYLLLPQYNTPWYILGADEQAAVKKFPTVIVKNTNVRGDTRMGHWIAFYLQEPGKYEYFDSYGQSLDLYTRVVAPEGECFAENFYSIQSSDSFLC